MLYGSYPFLIADGIMVHKPEGGRVTRATAEARPMWGCRITRRPSGK